MSGTQKRALVTGASTGIGRACARALRDKGFVVFAAARKPADLASLRAESLEPVFLDVLSESSIEDAVETIQEQAPGTLDVLVNNAGVAVGGPIEATPVSEIRRQFEVNLFGQIAVTQAFLPMLRSQKGRIINMTSIGGKVAAPYMGPYTASKHAFEAISDCLRHELVEFGVRVSIIEPGAILTPIWKKGEATVDEVERSLPEKYREIYGEALHRTRDVIARQQRVAIPPERVAKAVVHAATARRPKERYPVGIDARIGILLSRALPTRLMDRVVRGVR